MSDLLTFGTNYPQGGKFAELRLLTDVDNLNQK